MARCGATPNRLAARCRLALTAAILSLLVPASPALAARENAPRENAPRENAPCETAARIAEQEASLPPGLLAAIGLVETGRPAPGGALHGQPWAVDVRGLGYAFASKPQAAAYVVALIAAGMPAVDVGCFQVDLRWHPAAFPTLEAALDPLANARYAARYLAELHNQTANWPGAIARYHSASPQLGPPYAAHVLARWNELAAHRAPATPPVIPAALRVHIWYGSPR